MTVFGTRNVLGLGIVALLVGAFATAEAGVESVSLTTGNKLFQAADWNGDGAISGVEAGLAGAWLFGTLDRNRDGWVTYRETASAATLSMQVTASERRQMSAHISTAFIHMDTNGDSRVNKREFDDFGGSLFRMVDTDRNGAITWAELDPFLQQITGTAPAYRAERGDR